MQKSELILIILFAWTTLATSICEAFAEDDLPIVPDGFVVDVVAKEPMVSNPCVIAFDRQGRICVAQGQQWRAPTPETPGDRVDILLDHNGDGIADEFKTFAEGFNSIQGIAWHGDDLWIANAPDLTVVRDNDGDDIADVYLKVYTGLGNLEHSLHGLNFGPDGKLYMSKGNSKGYNRLDQLAPKAFRELWGLASPTSAPDYTPVQRFSKENYKRAYHTPQDDWGQQGGILRCDPYSDPTSKHPVEGMARNLEIFSRGFRNPWDICFDDGFDWLGTDNDQTEGDKVFAPFHGAHFGWGHPWSFHWTGIGHLPTIPISMPLYEGSGAGLIHYHSTHFPDEFRGTFFVNDWMRREVYWFKPEWDGALRRNQGGAFPEVFMHAEGGRSLPASSGRVFEPTDIEVGPDGALYLLSWGHAYGATIKNGDQVDAGRVYRIRHESRELVPWDRKRLAKPIDTWTFDELFHQFSSGIPAWRVNAQVELLRRGDRSVKFLTNRLRQRSTKAEQTWGLWTLGRLAPDALLEVFISQESDENVHLQSLRLLAQVDPSKLPPLMAWNSANARLRHATVQAAWQSNRTDLSARLVDLAATEKDRVVYYATWNAMRQLMSTSALTTLLEHQRPRVRLAALLALLLDDSLSADEVLGLRKDRDREVASVVELWLEKTGQGTPLITLSPPPGQYAAAVAVNANATIPRGVLTYTTDGSAPAMTDNRVSGPIMLRQDAKLRFSIFQDHQQAGATIDAEYRIRPEPSYRHREFLSGLIAYSGRAYEFDWTGLSAGKRHYTDRGYRVLSVPSELAGMPFLRTANEDDRNLVDRLVSFQSDSEVTVLIGVDARITQPLTWMRIGDPEGFRDTGLQIVTDDPTFNIFEKRFPAGEISLGPNLNHPGDSRRGNYIVLFKREILTETTLTSQTTVDSALSAFPDADAARGRELFLHPRGAGCFKCHQMHGIGRILGPDLSDIGNRAKEPRILMESILHPSRVITEGFAQQKILTIDGRLLAGSVLEETGRSLKIADSSGQVTTIQKDQIDERVGTKLSPMPDGYAKQLSPQQIADVTAWLMTQKAVGDRQGFWFQDSGDELNIHFGEQQIATYLKRHPMLTRRALVNVTTPNGFQLTRNFPPRTPEDVDPGYRAEKGIIHPVMHPGIWISFGDVDGNDYWRLQSRVIFDRFTETPSGDRETGRFSAVNRLLDKTGQREVCRETTRYLFERVPEGMLLVLDAEYVSDEQGFYFGDQEESGLAIRVASPIRVQGGSGTIVNDRGEENGAQVWGKEAKWFDYFGTMSGDEVGILVVPDPQNPRPSWLHARDYGVVVTNPFPKQPKERREPYVKTPIEKGERFRLRYAILFHDNLKPPTTRRAVAERIQARLSATKE
ncbi:MAG: PVC-type heme-binding CxxCH protein [Planctomycetota bacterium]